MDKSKKQMPNCKGRYFPMYPFKSRLSAADKYLYFTPDHTSLEICQKAGGGLVIPLTKEQLEIIDRTVGSRKLSGIKCFLIQKCNVQNVTGINWNDILDHLEFKTGKTEPTDLITLAVVVQGYQISRAQVKRDIDNGDIKSYRKKTRGKHIVSRKDVDNLYTKR